MLFSFYPNNINISCHPPNEKEKIWFLKKISHSTIHSQESIFFFPASLTLCNACTSEWHDDDFFCCFSTFGEHLIKNSRDDLDVNPCLCIRIDRIYVLATSDSLTFHCISRMCRWSSVLKYTIKSSLKRKWNLLIFHSVRCRYSLFYCKVFATDRVLKWYLCAKFFYIYIYKSGSFRVRTDYLIRLLYYAIRIWFLRSYIHGMYIQRAYVRMSSREEKSRGRSVLKNFSSVFHSETNPDSGNTRLSFFVAVHLKRVLLQKIYIFSAKK